LPEDDWEQADVYWLEAASRLSPELFPGVLETLERLRRNYLLGLVTSGSSERVRRDLGKRQLQEYFETIITGDDVQKPKPTPMGCSRPCRRSACQPTKRSMSGTAGWIGKWLQPPECRSWASKPVRQPGSGYPLLPAGFYIRSSRLVDI
jgi:hypothetical protein